MTYYDILGVPPSAATKDIRNAYLKLAKEFHPDKLAGIPPAVAKLAEEKFKDVQEAYEALTKHRAEYDNQLSAVGYATSPPNRPAAAPRPAPKYKKYNKYKKNIWKARAAAPTRPGPSPRPAP